MASAITNSASASDLETEQDISSSGIESDIAQVTGETQVHGRTSPTPGSSTKVKGIKLAQTLVVLLIIHVRHVYYFVWQYIA